MSSRIEGNLFVDGSMQALTTILSAGCVTDAKILAGSAIDPDKLRHRNRVIYSQGVGVDVVSDAKIVYVCNASGGALLKRLAAGAVTPAGATTTVDVDLKKNGVSMLTSVITLDNGQSAYDLVDPAGYSSTAIADGDVLTIHLTLTGSNEPQGVFAYVEVDEYPL